jgi:hypothetical protein
MSRISLVTGAGPLKSGQDLTCAAVLPGVALLLSHRDHEPSCDFTRRARAVACDAREAIVPPPLASGTVAVLVSAIQH